MIDEKKLIADLEKEREYWGNLSHPYAFELMCAYSDFIDLVNEQPKVGEWTPCSERLPEEARAVEVTMYDGNRAIGHFNNRLDTWFDSVNGGAIDVIA